MLKTILLNLLKFSLAVGLIGWLLASGKLDFKLLANLKDHPIALLTAVCLIIINFCLISVRWKSILKARSTVEIPLLGMLKISWIGQFFSSVLPGTVSGDLVKILYVQKFDQAFSKQFLFASILIDRVMGLAGLILLVGITTLCFSGHILENAPAMAPLLKFNYLLVILIIIASGIFMYWHQMIRSVLVYMQTKFLSGLFVRIIALWDDLVMIRSRMFKAIFLSIFIQLIGVVI